MECITLSGISPQVIEELRKGVPRTVELTSAHNVIALSTVAPGDRVFMTSIDCEDISIGDTGIIIEVLSLSISMKHVVEVSQGYHIMERERMSARCKVKHISNTTIKATVNPCRLTEPRRVDVVRPVFFHAG
jgi:uncharacterized protein